MFIKQKNISNFTVNKHIIHACFLYRSPNLDRASTFIEFDVLSDSIQRIVANYPHTETVIAGGFNVHNSSWLHFSGQTTYEERYVEVFVVDKPTRISDVAGQSANALDLFLTSDPNKYTFSVLTPLGTSDHCILSANFSCQKTQLKKKLL